MELQTILGADKGRNALYKVRDNFTILQEFANDANDNFIELYSQNIALEGQIENLNLQVFKMANNYRLPSDMPTSFQVGRTLFYADGAEWKASTGLSSAMIVETIVINGYYSIQYISGYNSSPLLYRICLSNNAWGPWREIVTTTPPDWITATLQNGWTGTLQYRKNQINQLEVKFDLVAGTITPYTLITTLPLQYSISHFVDIGGLSPDTGARSIFYYNSGSNSIYVSPDKSIVAGQKCAGSFVAPM